MTTNLISLIDPGAEANVTLSRRIVDETPFTPEVILRPWSHLRFNEARWLDSKNFLSTSLLVYDFDEGVPTLAEVTEQLVRLGYKHVIGPSKSHLVAKLAGKQVKPAVDRFRVVLFLDGEITDIASYKFTYVQVAKEFGWHAFDKQTIDVARFWRGCTKVTSEQLRGEEVSVNKYTFTSMAREVALRPAAVISARKKGKLNGRTTDFLLHGSEGNWHSEFIAAALDLKAQGYEEDEAATQLAKASPIGELDDTDNKQLADVYSKREPFHKERANWPKMIDTQKGPQLDKQASANFVIAVTEFMPNGPFKYYKNVLNNIVYINEKEGARVDDAHLTAAYAFCAEAGLAKDMKLIENAIAQAAEPYHPVKDFIKLAKWDGTDRVPALFSTLHLADDVTSEARAFYQDVLLRKWLYAAVKRLYIEGVENGLLILSGPQGAGKSRWFRNLAQKIWYKGYSDALIDPDNKDHLAYLVDSYIHHIAELDATTSTKHAGKLKDYLNKLTATFRRPYERTSVTASTICNFCATVNASSFLQDPTGSRRYFTIPIEGTDPDHEVDIQQVWAQAYEEAVVNNFKVYLTHEEQRKLNELNSVFQFEDDFEGLINSRVEPGEDSYSIKQICDELNISYDYLNKTSKERINSILHIKKIQQRNYGGRKMFKIDAKKLKMRDVYNVKEGLASPIADVLKSKSNLN